MTIGHHDGGNRWLGPTWASPSGSVSAKSYGDACSSTVAMYSRATENTLSMTAPASSLASRPYVTPAASASPDRTMKIRPADLMGRPSRACERRWRTSSLLQQVEGREQPDPHDVDEV